MAFLPVTKKEITERGWRQAEFLLVTGDAYAHHPSFGTGIISRALERYGYKVATLSQLSWKDAEDFRRLGRPRLGCLINGGNVAATVNHFSAGKRRLYGDKYSPEVQPEKDRTGG